MNTYYEQLLLDINKTETDIGRLILGEITAYQAYKLIVENADEDKKEDFISFKLEAYKAKKDGDYLEISTSSNPFFKKLVKEKSFAKRLIIFPDDTYQDLLTENASLTNRTLPILSEPLLLRYYGQSKALDAIKHVFNALVLDIDEACFKSHQVVLKGTSSSNSNLSLKGKVLCCFYKPNFIKTLDYNAGDMIENPYWSISGNYSKDQKLNKATTTDIYITLQSNDKYAKEEE